MTLSNRMDCVNIIVFILSRDAHTEANTIMKIVVLAGGLSPERDVSLSSASLIANALLSEGHEVALVDVYEGIESLIDLEGSFARPNSGHQFEYVVPDKAPDLDELIHKNSGRKALVGPKVIEICTLADVVFIGLHGAMGENGQLQALLDCFAIPYTGTGYCGSLLAMDKDLSKKLLRQAGIPTADWIMLDRDSDSKSAIINSIGFPCVIKPIHCGSSVGISIVEEPESLLSALDEAFKYESQVLAEKKIVGREFSVGVLDGTTLPAIEIIPKQGFYDYKNKYQKGMATEICPAPVSEEQARRLSEYTMAAHQALRLGAYARIDFILGQDGEFYCLEANTLPGMTPTSLLPQEAAAVGISYNELCDRIVKTAFQEKLN